VNLDLEYDIEGYYLEQEDILLDVYRKAQSCEKKHNTKKHNRHYRAVGRMLAWLGLAAPDKYSEFGHKPSRVLLRLKYNPNKRLKSKKIVPTCEEADAIELIFDAALGESKCKPDLRLFACNVLGVLGLVRFTKLGEVIPTFEFRAMASYRRTKERGFREAQSRRRRGNDDQPKMIVNRTDDEVG
jgi:hypothetical protein